VKEATPEQLGRVGQQITAAMVSGERLIMVFGGKQRAYALTNHRVIMADSGWLAGVGASTESARLSDIVSIFAGMGKLTIELTNGTAYSLPYGTIGGSTAKTFVQKVHAAQAAPAPTQAPSSAGGVADELAKLAQLRDQGMLSEDEFQAQKASLLSDSSR
jgi:hypothetical protein